MISTDRATTDEKARAWDHLMRSTGDDSTAVYEAWEYLRITVLAREDRAEDGLTP